MSIKHLTALVIVGIALLVSSCTLIRAEGEDLSFTVPKNAALVASSAYLDKHPEAIDTLALVADKMRTLANDPVIPVDAIFSQVSSVVSASSIRNKTACLAVLRSLIYEYNVTAVTAADYAFMLKELASGIIEAIDLYIFTHPTYVYAAD